MHLHVGYKTYLMGILVQVIPCKCIINELVDFIVLPAQRSLLLSP